MPLDVAGPRSELPMMTERKNNPGIEPEKQSRRSDAAFDLWLKRGLHELYDEVAKEPIPAELLRLIEEARKR